MPSVALAPSPVRASPPISQTGPDSSASTSGVDFQDYLSAASTQDQAYVPTDRGSRQDPAPVNGSAVGVQPTNGAGQAGSPTANGLAVSAPPESQEQSTALSPQLSDLVAKLKAAGLSRTDISTALAKLHLNGAVPAKAAKTDSDKSDKVAAELAALLAQPATQDQALCAAIASLQSVAQQSQATAQLATGQVSSNSTKGGELSLGTDPLNALSASLQAQLSQGTGQPATAQGSSNSTNSGELSFGIDPLSVLSAAQQAIQALTGGAGTQAAAGGQGTGITTAQTNAATAQLAQQGIISITGSSASQTGTAAAADLAAGAPAAQQILAAGAAVSTAATGRTIANQIPNPDLEDPSKPAVDVAAATIRQATSNMPMSRMSEIRAKLQAAELGNPRGAAVATDANSVAAATTSATSSGLAATVALEKGAQPGNTADKIAQQFGTIAASEQTIIGKTPGTAAAEIAASGGQDQSSQDQASVTDPSIAGLVQSQGQAQQGQDAPTPAPAIPLAGVPAAIVAHAKAGDSEFNIRLDPAGLGQIDVKMKVSSDGEVRAHLIVDQPATLDLMMRDRQQLQQSLDQAGFKTDPSSLQFSLRDQQQNQQQNQQQAGRGQSQQNSAANPDAAITPQQNFIYTRQSYIRADAIDVSV